MPRRLLAAMFCCLLLQPACELPANEPASDSDALPIDVAAEDWPWWRGPQRNGIAAAGQKPPLEWSETENVLWKAKVPGRSHGSPTIVGEQVFLLAADHEADVQAVLCFDRNTGRQLWKTIVHRGGLSTKGNGKSSQASSTPACDGQKVFVNFLNGDAVYTTALGRDGKILWQTKISDYVVHQGYGSSPAVYNSHVIVTADNKAGGAVAALDRANGKIVWKHARPSTPNYASPIVLRVDDREQLLLTGCDLVSGYDPASGKKLWEVAGATTECVTSTVTDGEIIITSGGYPKSHVTAVRADGSGEVVWEHNVRVYVPSMLIHEGSLYAVTDAGVAMCFKAARGEELWKERLGGTFSASPVLAAGNIYATNESGKTFVYKANPERYEAVAENQLGSEVLSTPAICGSRIYARIAQQSEGRRQELLYCIGK